jgi:hypothetical protein
MRWVWLFLVTAGCAGPGDRSEGSSRMMVDSALPGAVALSRFRAGLPVVSRLSRPAASRDALASRIADRIARADTAALAGMRIGAAEFAHLYYESTPQSRPPYELPPELMWLQMEQQSDRGLRRLLGRFGGTAPTGQPTCDPPRQEGVNTIHPRCRFVGEPAVPIGTLIERPEGVMVLSWANDL